MRLALCGNPNVGKTTIFNRMTRSDAPVGNWHGVTIDAREKRIVGTSDTVVDLPGAYSLTARSKEETVTRDGILFGGFDVILFVAEVNNLRRNLYLLTQVMETGARVVLVVNMMDEARGKTDLAALSRRLGVPVIGTSCRAKNPTGEILDAVKRASKTSVPYANNPLVIETLRSVRGASEKAGIPPVFAAMKTLENDAAVTEKIGGCGGGCGVCGGCARADLIDEPARIRYGFIDSVLNGAVERSDAYALTRKIDKLVLGRAALPIFLLVMSAVFVVTFEAAKPLSALLSRLIGIADKALDGATMPDWVNGLLRDGVIGGVGAVLAFLPQVVLLFLMTALLQDSGYMSRVAFVTDGFFKKLGLSGRAAFSMLLGLGCSATAILSTRGIAEKSSRRRAAFSLPFVPCSARLGVFVAVAGYFGLGGAAVAAMYVLGFVAALVVLWIMRAFGARTDGETLLMEMPPYRVPSLKRVFKSVLSSVVSFITRVGSVVLGVSIIMWVLSSFSFATGFGDGSTSIMHTFASFIAPVFAPLGFNDWRAATALISGVAAKETLVSVISALGGMGAVFGSRLSALSFLIFSCLYVPCVATLAALSKECGLRTVAASIAVHTATAYLSALLFYQSAVLFETNRAALVAMWSAVAAAVAAIVTVKAILTRKRKTRLALERNGKA